MTTHLRQALQPTRETLATLESDLARTYLSLTSLLRRLEAEQQAQTQLHCAASLARLGEEFSYVALFPLTNPADQRW